MRGAPDLHRLARRIVAAAALALAALTAPAQDAADGQRAIDQLKQLPVSVQKVREVIQASNFGPFQIGGSCKYNGVWYCLWTNCTTFTWTWPFPQYAWLRDALDQRFRHVQDVSAQFDGRFAPVKSWLLETLPSFDAQFEATSVRLQEIEAALRRPAASPADVERARQEIVQAIETLNASLRQGSDQLRAGLAGLATFNQQLDAALQSVENERAGMEQMISADERRLNDEIGGWPCGTDGARQGYAGIRDTVRRQFENVVAAAQTFGVGASQTDAAVSLLLGRVLNLVNAHQQVLDSLQAARITPAGAVQQLRLNLAGAGWQDLAAYARRELGG